jgi:hypothetical protein
MDRESIWSVPARWQTTYFTLFGVSFTTGTALTIWQECCLDRSSEGVVKSLLDIMQGAGSVAIASAAFALVVTEVVTMLSAVVTRLSEQYLAKRYEQGRTEARAETLVEVEKWNQRRLAAEAKGEPFDEPLPSTTKQPSS